MQAVTEGKIDKRFQFRQDSIIKMGLLIEEYATNLICDSAGMAHAEKIKHGSICDQVYGCMINPVCREVCAQE